MRDPPVPDAAQYETIPDDGAPHAEEETNQAVCAIPPPGPVAMPSRLAPLVDFWIKINNDWIFNLAGLLAYNFIVTLFPILLLLLGGVGVLLGQISPAAEQEFQSAIAALLPAQIGQVIVAGIVSNLKSSVSLLLLVGFVGAFLAGSHLFITLENCFGVIFRLRGRNFLRQNLMAIGMLLVYLLFVPAVFLGSLMPPLLRDLLPRSGHGAVAQFIIRLSYPLVTLIVTTVAIGLTYVFVPNRPVTRRTLRNDWKGAALAAALAAGLPSLLPVVYRTLRPCRQLWQHRRLCHHHFALLLLPGCHSPARRGGQLLGGRPTRDRLRSPWHAPRHSGPSQLTRRGWSDRRNAPRRAAAPRPRALESARRPTLGVPPQETDRKQKD